MPYVNGESLRDRLRREIQLPMDVALGIGRQIAGALDYAHQRGVVHRDIKPENVLFRGDQALVADFGGLRPEGSDAILGTAVLRDMPGSDTALRESTTTLLASGDLTDPVTLDHLVPAIYEELRAMARRQLAGERPGHTLQTTALVHEAYLRLVDHAQVTAHGRAYFFGAASRAMRQVLVEHARRRGAGKRQPGTGVPSLGAEGSVDAFAADLLDLNRALDKLTCRHPRQARVVECRYFGGMSVEETADALEVSSRTVKYDWAMARAWLFRELSPDAAS